MAARCDIWIIPENFPMGWRIIDTNDLLVANDCGVQVVGYGAGR
jgi:hypothetical protein